MKSYRMLSDYSEIKLEVSNREIVLKFPRFGILSNRLTNNPHIKKKKKRIIMAVEKYFQRRGEHYFREQRREKDPKRNLILSYGAGIA